MRCVYWGFVLLNLAHSSFTVTTADSETVIIPPPTFKIEIEKENYLDFHFNVFDVKCTLLTFYFTKCNENATIHCSYGKRCAVEYDSACKYTVWAQENSSSYCLKKFQSPMSEPVYFEIVPPPKFKIELGKDNFLDFHFNVSDFRCTLLTFYYTKCNENATIPCSHGKRCAVEYDSACKYTVWAQENSSSYCLKKFQSPMSEPVYFGEDKDPNIRFKVIMIMIPVLLTCCLFVALILFQRHKNAIFPKVPDPSQFIKEMFDKNKNGDIFKGQVGKLFEAHEVVTDTVSVETKTSLIQPRPEPVIIDEA